MATKVIMDIETGGPPVIITAEEVYEYELQWIDAALHDAPPGALPNDFSRTRRFKHMGATIAWGRRKIFHGAIFADAIDLVPICITTYSDGRTTEAREDPFEMTLKGFSRWGSNSYDKRLFLGKTTRKCRTNAR